MPLVGGWSFLYLYHACAPPGQKQFKYTKNRHCGYTFYGCKRLKTFFSHRQNLNGCCLHTAEVGSSNLPAPTTTKGSIHKELEE